METQDTIVFGIDLGTTYSCIAYVDEYGKAVVIPNADNDHTTPSVVQFEGKNRVVGKEAKNSAVLNPDSVVEMVKRQMGSTDWRFHYEGDDYRPEEISSYILRKVADDAEQNIGRPVTDVVITCPAYFGIAQREATARAGEIVGLKVREVINEPTAAAIMYGLQNEQDQVVLIYDLGGGTFDITVIEIKGGAITVVATGGDHDLGGRNWDEAIVGYLAERWMEEMGSSDDPTDSVETLQDLWGRAETAKRALTSKQETSVPVIHAGQRVGVTLTRDKFNELTANLLGRTIDYTKATMEEAQKRGFNKYDQILLVGGSTRMPQVTERLKAEFNLPLKVHDPDESVAKGAAVYGQKLLLDEKLRIKIAERQGVAADDVELSKVSTREVERAQQEVAHEGGYKLSAVKQYTEMSVTNVASHSFGVVVMTRKAGGEKEVIANLVLMNDPLPVTKKDKFGTYENDQPTAQIRIMENDISEQEAEPYTGKEIGDAVLPLPPRLAAGSPIEVTFELNREGRLHVTGRELSGNRIIEATIQTEGGFSQEEMVEAKERSSRLVVS